MINLRNKNWNIDSVDTILFDKDGTFLNDHIYWGKLSELRIYEIIEHFNIDKVFFKKLCTEIGYNTDTSKLIKNGPVGVMSRNEVVEFMVNNLVNYNVKTDFETISKIFDIANHKFLNNIEKYVEFLPYAENFIKKLKSLKVKLGVVTSDSFQNTIKILKILKIEDCFSCVVGKDNSKYDKKTGEPALIAVNKLNADIKNTIAIGDAIMDFEMAKNAGLKGVILVATGQTDYQILKKCSDCVVDNLSEIFLDVR